jgi:molybdopterin-biosynthesis enzyme MoeA-like protein
MERELKQLVEVFENFLQAYTRRQTAMLQHTLSESLTTLLKESVLNEALMKVDDVADELQVSSETIRQWHKQGKIPGHYMSNRLFFFRSEIYEAIKKQDMLRLKLARRRKDKGTR